MWTAHAVHITRPPLLPIAVDGGGMPEPPAADRVVPYASPRRADSDERLDLYGNGVSTAVATYTYDRAGILYEEHSPQTEVPRLKPPVS